MRIFFFLIITTLAVSLFAQTNSAAAPLIRFSENKGQWQGNILFRADLSASSIFLEKNCITFDLGNESDMEKLHGHHLQNTVVEQFDGIVRRHCYKLYFEGCNSDIEIEKNIRSLSYSNYFLGSDKSHWKSEVYAYAEIIYKNIYDGIDLKVYSRGANFKYDFIVHPGADINTIKLRYEGLDNIALENNTLRLIASFANLSESPPLAYVQTDAYKLPVNCNYHLDNNFISFSITQLYDRQHTLIIDPELVFASYSGSTFDNWGYTATYDLSGNLYGGGIIFGTGYPVTVGAYETSYQGGDGSIAGYPYDNGLDIAISKFSSDGTTLIYSTYFGGSGNELPHSLITDAAGNLYVYGTTGSEDFPTSGSAYDNSFNGGVSTNVDDGIINFPDGVDIFISKFNAAGSALPASTFIGGTGNDGLNLSATTQFNYGDFARGEIILDESNNIYIASSTSSTDFPTTAFAFQLINAGGQDAVVLSLNNTLSSLLWSSYLGGSASDGAYSIKRNAIGDVLIAGGTASSNFPVTSGAWNETYGGATDGWAAKINSSGSSILSATYIGTNDYDQTYFVETDAYNFVYITGQTKGSYPVINADYSEANGTQFITKLNEDLSDVEYSMVFGSGSSTVNISPSAFLVDVCENVYVSGWGGAVNFEGSTSGMSITPDAIQSSTDGSDFYFFVLQKNAVDILFGSYFGGDENVGEHVDGGTSRFDKSGTIYQGVCAGCGGYNDFPTTDGAWSEINGTFNCNLGVAKIKLNLVGVFAESVAEPSFSGCDPFTVDFDNLSSDAEEYIWDFGDGSANSTEFEPSHTYTEPGLFEVMLIVVDSATCNIRDTSYLTIEVLNGDIIPAVDFLVEQNCDSLVLTTVDESVVFPTTEYFWNFGDGETSTLSEPSHTYYVPGTYLVQLILTDSTACNKTDTIEYEVNYLFDFNPGYTVITDGCLPVEAIFTALFDSADTFLWDFGDGTFAETQTATHTYTEPGDYTVHLTISYCGYTDEFTEVFSVYELPIAYFDAEPALGIINGPTTFYNLSENAVSYLWEFSDGTSSVDENAVHTFESLGNSEVCLTATNAAGCTDTYCRDIIILEEGAADVPTGFSPNGDGANDILFVKGFGFAHMDFKIFNRWGELVFQSTDQKIGWDGTLREKDLDMDVFVFILKVDFTDGSRIEKKGNVTLIR